MIVTIDINASPEQVFQWIVEPARSRQWLPNLVEDENIHETENKVGSTWRQVYEENGRRMEMFGITTVYEPNKRMCCVIKGSMFDLDVDYQLENLGNSTRLTQCSQVTMKGFFKLLGLLIAPMMKKAQTKQAEDCFRTLKQLVEESKGS